MEATVPNLVGREEELAALLELVDTPAGLPSVAVVAGEAGIGKTALWLAGVELAAARDVRVLASRPSEAEAGFSFLALTDLLGGVAADVLPELPPIQRRALEAALLLGDSDARADPRAVAAGFLGALRLLAADGPLLLAVDDVQWLDPASLSALRFALARLEHERVAMVLAVRGDVPEWVRRSVPEARLRALHVGGLSLGATHELLHHRLDASFSRPVLIKLWETAGGNPFFALELAAALQRRGGTLTPGEDLPIPTAMDELLRARLDGLGADALDVASAVAALAEPTGSLVESAVGTGYEAGLDEAVSAGILELDGERLRFAHTLLGSAVAARLTPARRRRLHARLAEVVPTAEERARHLALATAEPDGAIAAILEDASQAALERGAPAGAADLAEQALRLTPTGDTADAQRRLMLAAERHDLAGDTDRAIALLERARDGAAAGLERAEALVRLADVQDDPRATVPLYREALAEAAADDELAATVHTRLALSMAWDEGAEAGLAHAELALEAASRIDDPEIRCRALAAYGDWNFRAGRGMQRARMDEAMALERSLSGWPLDRGPTDLFARQLVLAADLGAARDLLHELHEAHTQRDNADGASTATWWLSLLEWRAGDWEAAERYAAESFDIRLQLGNVMPGDGFPVALLAAHLGRVDEARAESRLELAMAEAMGIRISVSGSAWILGFLELSMDDPGAALVHLSRSYELRSDFMLEPAQRLELGDYLEALVGVGELDEAERVIASWHERADWLDRASTLAVLARTRGLVLAARGDLDGAFASFDEALREHARAEDPFQRARTLLALGATQRRAKQRAAARATLEQALAAFERLGARLWADKARADLGRIGGRAPSRGHLTESERRIAALVAEGHTNREVAAALFVTEHTVEGALTRVYRKLGIRSRGELAARLDTRS
ncbi:MAG TPA: AAA family ATPase [Gaiellaceae bacterium]|nr:AAA family ATPase [Gaiellaceae bacterium]